MTTKPSHLDLVMYQGATFKEHFVWGCGEAIEITGISKANPAVVTAENHGLPTGQTIVIVDVKGMVSINDTVYTITVIDTDSFSLDGLDTTSDPPYLSGGYATVPNDLTGYSAQMHIRPNTAADDTIEVLTTGNGKIILGGANGVIELLLDATETANIKKGTYLYDLELISPGSEVERLLQGYFKVDPEITR